MILYMWTVRGLSYWSKIPFGLSIISKVLSTTSIKTLWPAHTLNTSKDRWILCDNNFTSIIDTYFYETFSNMTSQKISARVSFFRHPVWCLWSSFN